MIEKIDICITSTIRPLILDKTLSSFTTKMLTDQSRYNIIINIDPIGEKIKAKEVIKVVKKYFSNIKYNIPSEPGFTKAVKWCWENTTEKYVFHLEDDWELLTNINIDSMIEIFNNNEDLVSLRLNKEKTGKSKHSTRYGFIYHPKISLNPTLFKGYFLRNVSQMMKLNFNPEKQLRPTNDNLGNYISKFKNGIYTKDSCNSVVFDIGRDWMNKSRYTKKTGFMYWNNK